MIELTKNSATIKRLKKLKQLKYVKQELHYIVYGEHIIELAAKQNLISELLVTNALIDYPADKKYLVDSQVLKELTDVSGLDAVAIVEIRPEQQFDKGNVLVLDNIQDPGNLGTILRSARSFGFTNVVLSPTCVSIYNAKVLRAMQGVHFELNIVCMEIYEYLKMSDKLIVTTFLDENHNYTGFAESVKEQTSINLVFGNEGQGIDEQIKALTHQNFKIKTQFESLNVAIAASIIMYEIGEKNG
ncbi:MAG: TrmH family RNA methyltransferase [Mycoplasmatales bacterium]